MQIESDYPAHWLEPDWAIPGVRAYCTTRYGNLSAPPYDGFNTADHVGDDPQQVARLRQLLVRYFGWQRSPQWLHQVHGAEVVEAAGEGQVKQADALYSRAPGVVCTIHTADCLPIFFADVDGSLVGLIHAGWRGLAQGIIQNTVQRLAVQPSRLRVWLGPAISAQVYEVGADVRSAFLQQNPEAALNFTRNHNDRWQCDLYGLAQQQLQALMINKVSGGGYCTYRDERFFSFRRNSVTGRMLSMIWLDADQ